ncbi:MAG: hypothetical protein ABR921_20805 [Candidatus Sulfotelmatobacter sp.]|jgi:hypothetical protein
MFIPRMLVGRKLGLTLAFTVLIALAFGVSCTGFFPPNSLTAITIQPPSPQIEVGTPQGLQAWGTYANNTGTSQITSGVVWTSSDNTVLTINPTTGVATGVGTGGSATVTASAQGLSGTASATVYLGTLTSFEVCMGTFGNTTSCSDGSSPLIWNADASGTPSQPFVAQGVSGGTTYDFTTASTWTVVTQPANGGTIQCTNSDVSPETCTVSEGSTAATYAVTVTYGTTSSATISIVVTN